VRKMTRIGFLTRETALVADASFVSYIGDADFHDGVVVAVERRDDTAHVRVQGASGKVFVVSFGGVRAIRAQQPEGMMLYALTELSAEPPLRQFVFANWDDDSPAYLAVDAETIEIREE
jgi:hypothetical protein